MLSPVLLLLWACTQAPVPSPATSPAAELKPDVAALVKTERLATQPPPEVAQVSLNKAVKKISNKTTVAAPMPPIETQGYAEAPVVQNILSLDHSRFDSLLQKYVSDAGKVNYKGLKAAKAELDAYCQYLSDHPVQESWSKEEKMAYWMNAYNAFTLKLIVDNYPTKSILNFDGGKTWDVRRIKLGDKKYSLNNIENDILRPMFKDPRIHFAINCAAQSCPPLWNRAFTAENIESALEARTRAFINDPAFNNLTAGRAQVSKIFEWYAVDFGKLPDFLNTYADKPLSPGAAIRFQEYNWDLNEAR